MKMSRTTLYTLVIGTLLLIIVLILSFFYLIPKGKEYRSDRIEKKKEAAILSEYESYHADTLKKLKELQEKHKYIINAYDNNFEPQKFKAMNSDYFHSLELSKSVEQPSVDEFVLYEVNATTKISTPESFYTFLTSINRGEWIISVDFPINFEREDRMIRASFTMRVHNVNKNKPVKTDSAQTHEKSQEHGDSQEQKLAIEHQSNSHEAPAHH